jgi:hypothetical protein
MKYFNEAKFLWQNYVPKSGQAETIQGELIRAIVKLQDEAQRNGNGNWDQGFEIFCQFILLNGINIMKLQYQIQIIANQIR